MLLQLVFTLLCKLYHIFQNNSSELNSKANIYCFTINIYCILVNWEYNYGINLSGGNYYESIKTVQMVKSCYYRSRNLRNNHIFLCIPSLGKDIIASNPEFSSWFWPWLIFLWITSIPCYAVLICIWKITKEIKRQFILQKNADLLKLIAIFAAGDSAFLFTGNIILLLLNMNHPGSFFWHFLLYLQELQSLLLPHFYHILYIRRHKSMKKTN